MSKQKSKDLKKPSTPPLSLRRRFQLQVAKLYPGVKTRVITACGAVGSGSTLVLGYVKDAPLDQIVSAKHLAIAGLILFTLAYWCRSLSNNEPIS